LCFRAPLQSGKENAKLTKNVKYEHRPQLIQYDGKLLSEAHAEDRTIWVRIYRHESHAAWAAADVPKVGNTPD
jgi:hypothetical protein